MADIFRVRWGKKVAKQLERVPLRVTRKFYAWVRAIKLTGIRMDRQSPGFHDEPLAGVRRGQRSVRLNKAYRAIYREGSDGNFEIIEIVEVTHHEY